MAYLRMVMREANELPMNMVSGDAAKMKVASAERQTEGYMRRMDPIPDAPQGRPAAHERTYAHEEIHTLAPHCCGSCGAR